MGSGNYSPQIMEMVIVDVTDEEMKGKERESTASQREK